MTPEGRAASLVRVWVRLYTRSLPAAVGSARQEEIASDVWEQREDARRASRSSAATAWAIAHRALAGVTADIGWRRAHVLRLAIHDAAPASETVAPTFAVALNRRIDLLLLTRRCHACGRRYQRRLPYCPVCKTGVLQDVVDRRA